MPSGIHVGSKTYRLRQNFGYAVEYVATDDISDVIQIINIYRRTGSEKFKNVRHFNFN